MKAVHFRDTHAGSQPRNPLSSEFKALLILAQMRDHLTNSFIPRLPEWWASFVLFGIGIMLQVNTDLMANRDLSIYDLMLNFGSQETLSSLLIAFAAIRLIVLFINGAWRRSPHARGAMAFASCFPWALIMMSFYQSFGFAFVMSAGWLGIEMINIMRAMQDAATVDEKFRRGAGSGYQ